MTNNHQLRWTLYGNRWSSIQVENEMFIFFYFFRKDFKMKIKSCVLRVLILEMRLTHLEKRTSMHAINNIDKCMRMCMTCSQNSEFTCLWAYTYRIQSNEEDNYLGFQSQTKTKNASEESSSQKWLAHNNSSNAQSLIGIMIARDWNINEVHHSCGVVYELATWHAFHGGGTCLVTLEYSITSLSHFLCFFFVFPSGSWPSMLNADADKR